MLPLPAGTLIALSSAAEPNAGLPPRTSKLALRTAKTSARTGFSPSHRQVTTRSGVSALSNACTAASNSSVQGGPAASSSAGANGLGRPKLSTGSFRASSPSAAGSSMIENAGVSATQAGLGASDLLIRGNAGSLRPSGEG